MPIRLSYHPGPVGGTIFSTKGRPGVLLGEFQVHPLGYFGPGQVRVTEDHLTISPPQRTF